MGTSFHSYPSLEPSAPNAAILEKPEVIVVLFVQDRIFAGHIRKHAQELQQQHSNSTTQIATTKLTYD